jgi:hypothetical protein
MLLTSCIQKNSAVCIIVTYNLSRANEQTLGTPLIMARGKGTAESSVYDIGSDRRHSSFCDTAFFFCDMALCPFVTECSMSRLKFGYISILMLDEFGDNDQYPPT